MRPTQHPSNNDVLRAPPGVPIEECQPLAITRVRFEQGGEFAVWSYWRPSAAELKAIADGALIRLSIAGLTHPPLHVGVDGVDDG